MSLLLEDRIKSGDRVVLRTDYAYVPGVVKKIYFLETDPWAFVAWDHASRPTDVWVVPVRELWLESDFD